MAITDTNPVVSQGNFITSARLHFMPLNHCYCSPKQHSLSAWILTIPSLSRGMLQRRWKGLLLPGTVPWYLRQRYLKKPLCAFTLAPLVHAALLKRIMLTQVTVLTGSAVLPFPSLQIFSGVLLLPASSKNLPGCVKVQGTMQNSLRPEEQLYLRWLSSQLATLRLFSKHIRAGNHNYWERIIN